MSPKPILSSLLLLASTGLVLAEGGFIELRLGQLRHITQLPAAHVGEFPNGTAGLSMSTTACNMGTLDIPWWSIYGDADRSPESECPFDPPDGMSGCHPSMGMEIYRLRDGRLDQIGLSWLVHGWYALASSQCTHCMNGDPSGNHLGVGCSTTEGVGGNGARSDLGPRSEWNPHTNEWEPCGSHFDGPNNDCRRSSHTHGPVDHRLRVADADLYAPNNPGAEYFYQV
ncbi:MAG: hypothetical protein IID39_08535, partial [Planctomycetes bacterium]|nr:hypothetical protein [Planctomycetota bacterium]